MAQLREEPRRPAPARELPQHEMYITYDLAQPTRGGGTAVFPKVKRVYIPGEVVEWGVGRFRKRSGRMVFGVRISYLLRDGTGPARHGSELARDRRFTQVIDLPDAARNVQLHEAQHPGRPRMREIR